MNTPQFKTILVLANSLKKGGRCVAGVEATNVGGNTYALGQWIRPIDSEEDEGTIPSYRTLLDGRYIKPLDLVTVPFLESANDPYHPEDIKIDGSKRWRLVGHMDAKDVFSHLADETGDLWGPASAYSRKVKPTHGIKTLRLIKPAGKCHVSAFREDTPWGPKNRRFLYVTCNGKQHEFSIDDPDFSRRHSLSPTAVGDKTVKIHLDPEKTVIVASLTRPYVKDGMQYKIAAAIFEL
jgi:hypothetical protein